MPTTVSSEFSAIEFNIDSANTTDKTIFEVKSMNNQVFRIDSANVAVTNKLGVGTTNPSTTLHIIGAIKATDSVSFTGLLPMSSSTDSVVVRDVNGKFGTTAKSAFGSTYSAGYGLSLASTTFSLIVAY